MPTPVPNDPISVPYRMSPGHPRRGQEEDGGKNSSWTKPPLALPSANHVHEKRDTMSAFSFTAPYVSDADERTELESLTPKELEVLRQDLYGAADVERKGAFDESNGHNEPCIPETPQMVENALTLMNRAVEEITEKRDYDRAKRDCPDLVDKESPALLFLRYSDYNPWAAAEQLVLYWKVRRETFAENAWLPMNILGDGAMSPQDIDVLNQGVAFLLPRDARGRTIFFVDRIRMVAPLAPRKVALRVFFYLMQVILQSEKVSATDENPQEVEIRNSTNTIATGTTREKGYVIVVNARGYDLYKHFDRIFSKRLVCIENVFPVRLRAAHCYTGSGRSVIGMVLPVLKHIYGKRVRQRYVVHAGSNTEALAESKPYGLRQEHIDTVYGSLLQYIQWGKEWTDRRREIELLQRKRETESS